MSPSSFPSPRIVRILVKWLLSAALTVVLSACGDRGVDWALYNVRGHLPDLSFTLDGAGGQTVTQDALKGKTVLLFFGYASCPDICPTTLAQLTEVLRRLGPDADEVRIVFVSVDPHRDSPERLQAYVSAFNPSTIGLTGDVKAITDLARRYRVAFQIETPPPGEPADRYDVTHSRGVYVFDNAGRARLLASDTTATEVMAKDLKQLIELTRPSR